VQHQRRERDLLTNNNNNRRGSHLPKCMLYSNDTTELMERCVRFELSTITGN
jgi:hypothetical protein